MQDIILTDEQQAEVAQRKKDEREKRAGVCLAEIQPILTKHNCVVAGVINKDLDEEGNETGLYGVNTFVVAHDIPAPEVKEKTKEESKDGEAEVVEEEPKEEVKEKKDDKTTK